MAGFFLYIALLVRDNGGWRVIWVTVNILRCGVEDDVFQRSSCTGQCTLYMFSEQFVLFLFCNVRLWRLFRRACLTNSADFPPALTFGNWLISAEFSRFCREMGKNRF
jgi:hypothetical protein